MGVFDFLFGSSLTIERLVKLDESELQEKLKKRNISELQKFCLKGCKNLNNEEKQKEIYVNAIMEFIREKRAELENSQLSENVKSAIENSVTSKPVDLDKSAEQMNSTLSENLEKPVDEKMPPPAVEGPPRPMGQPVPGNQRPDDDVDDDSDMFDETKDEKMGEKPRGGKYGSKKRGGRTRRKREKKAKEEKMGGKRRNSRKK